jgi:TPR repeat protein
LGYLEYIKETDAGDQLAFKYFTQAAKQGHPMSTFHVGLMTAEGRVVGKDLVKAVEWLTIAEEKNIHDAMYIIARIHFGDYGGTPDTQKSRDKFLKIINNKSLEGSEIWTLAVFYFGRFTLGLNDAESQKSTDLAFSEVLRSELKSRRVNWAKAEIAEFVKKGLTKAGVGDGSKEDAQCQKFGFAVVSDTYSQCRFKLQVARKEAEEREKIYELEKKRHELAVARYQQQLAEQERAIERAKGEALMKFGLGLMAGQSPYASENLTNATRQMLDLPPAPQRSRTEMFTITNPQGRIINCSARGNSIDCF